MMLCSNILLCFLLFVVELHASATAGFNYTLPTNFPTILQGSVEELVFNLTGVSSSLAIEPSSSDPNVFTAESTVILVNPVYERVVFPNGSAAEILQSSSVQSISIPVRGVSFGIARLVFVVRNSMGLIDPDLQILQPLEIKVRRDAGPLGSVFNYILLVWLMVSYVTMGVKLEWSVIRGKLRRPFGVVIGAVCQFVIMPGMAALIARAMNLELTTAIAVIILGSCPGGWLSNMFTLLLDCDLVLSLTMTFCSTVIALAFMPLNLFIYANPYANNDSNIRLPFLQIFIQLITLVVPLLIGTYVSHRFQRAAKWFHRLLKPLAVALIVVGLALGIWANYFAFLSPPDIFFATILLAPVAGILGFFVAKATCLSNRSAITIAIETGAQNSFLAISVIGMSFPQPEADLMVRVPVLAAFFTFLILCTITAMSVVMQRFPGRFELPVNESRDEADVKNAEQQDGSKDLSSRITGFGSKHLKTTSKYWLKREQQPPFSMSSKSTQVDFGNGLRSTINNSGGNVNRAFVHERDTNRHVSHSPVSISNISAIGYIDPDTRNYSAKQVYL